MLRISSWMLSALLAMPLAAQASGPDVARKLSAASDALAAGNGYAAVLVLEDLVQSKPDLGAAWYQLALARRLLHRDAEAFKAAEQAGFLMPESVDARLLIAEMCASSDAARASQLASGLLEGGDDEAMLRRLLPILVTARDARTASLFDRILAKAPGDLGILELKAQWALGRQDLKVALQALGQIVALEPQNPVPLQSLAQVQLAAGKRDAAAETFTRLVAVNPSNLEARARLIELLRQQQKDPALIVEHQRLLAFYRAQVQRWESQGKTDARPTVAPPGKPAK